MTANINQFGVQAGWSCKLITAMDQRHGGRVCVRGGRGGRGRGRGRVPISDEFQAAVIDHVLVHGMTTREAGQRVQPNISRFSVSTIIQRFRHENRIARLPYGGGRTPTFTPQQEATVADIVRQNNVITLQEIQQQITENHTDFEGVSSVSLSTADRILTTGYE